MGTGGGLVIGQRARGLPESVKDEGCAFLCLCYLAWREGPLDAVWSVSRVTELYEDAVLKKAMRRDCYVLDWQKLADIIAPGLFTFVGKSALASVSEDTCIVMYHYQPRNWYHFIVAPHGKASEVEYDPWQRSVTASCGVAVDARVFRVNAKNRRGCA